MTANEINEIRARNEERKMRHPRVSGWQSPIGEAIDDVATLLVEVDRLRGPIKVRNLDVLLSALEAYGTGGGMGSLQPGQAICAAEILTRMAQAAGDPYDMSKYLMTFPHTSERLC